MVLYNKYLSCLDLTIIGAKKTLTFRSDFLSFLLSLLLNFHISALIKSPPPDHTHQLPDRAYLRLPDHTHYRQCS